MEICFSVEDRQIRTIFWNVGGRWIDVLDWQQWGAGGGRRRWRDRGDKRKRRYSSIQWWVKEAKGRRWVHSPWHRTRQSNKTVPLKSNLTWLAPAPDLVNIWTCDKLFQRRATPEADKESHKLHYFTCHYLYPNQPFRSFFPPNRQPLNYVIVTIFLDHFKANCGGDYWDVWGKRGWWQVGWSDQMSPQLYVFQDVDPLYRFVPPSIFSI